MEAKIEPLLSTIEVAIILGIKPATLEQWRTRGQLHGLKYVTVGRLRKYRPSDVQAFIEANLRRHTSENGGEAPKKRLA